MTNDSTQSTNTSEQHENHRSMRRDATSEKAVEVGIRLQEILGTSDAANFLKNHMIDIKVALRVLLHPEQRRKS